MNDDTRLLPDDPKLTAYAFGELTGDERAAVEAALRQNPALRVTVDEIRAIAEQVTAALAVEATAPIQGSAAAQTDRLVALNGHTAVSPPTRARRRAAIRSSGPAKKPDVGRYPSRRRGSKLIQFPQFYYVVGGFAAACFAVMVALYERPAPIARAPVARTVIREIALAPLPNTPGEPVEVETIVPSPSGSRMAGAGAADNVASATEGAALSTSGSELAVTQVRPWARFIEDDLSLLAQARRLRELTSRPVGSVGSGVGEKVASDATPAESRRRPLPEKITVNPPAPPVPVNVTPTVGLPGSRTMVRATPVTATPGTSEVITLSAFVVTADRGNGFAATTTAQRAAAGKRGVVDRDDLPVPPPGAKFGRNTEAYAYVRDNDFLPVVHNELSTFAIDVDTASYANVRRILEHGTPPPRDAVRIEELLNYFPYRYAAPKGNDPFAVSLEVADAPWAPRHKLVRVGLKAREVTTAQRAAANLVFLLDVSGSMDQPNKLPLVKQSLRLLIGKLRPDDRVAIVTYAGTSGLALASTPVARSREILNALDALTPGGSTNGAMGIQLAYEIAKSNFATGGINRVILCTDGDFNVGTTSEGELVRLIEEKAGSGVFLTVLGFGMGNYKDATLEKLANKGNGNYGYIDTRREAEKLLVEQVSSTLVTVAKDVKVQVEFNPARVHSYRLIGYENRLLRKEDFNNDQVDAGEMGAGHTVTALYEIIPVGAEEKSGGVPAVDTLKYAARGAVSSRLEMPAGGREPLVNELLTVKVRFKKPDSLISWPKTLEFPLIDGSTAFVQASSDFRFAAAVAQFGMILRGSPHRGTATMAEVGAWAAAAAKPEDDPGGYRSEFIELVRKAQTMME